MMRAEALASLQRAALLASRLGGQAIAAKPAVTTVHHALRTACTVLSISADHGGKLARQPLWHLPHQQQQHDWRAASRGFSAAHAAAAAQTEPELVVTEKAVQVS